MNCLDVSLYRLTLLSFELFSLIVNGSTELRRVIVATVLGKEEGHAFQYLPGENDATLWPGNYV